MMDYVEQLRKADRPEPVSAEKQIYFRTIEEDLLAAQDPASARFWEDCD